MRFVSAIIILLFHGRLLAESQTPLFEGGAVFVEFFFIVSGYLMASNAFKLGETDMKELGPQTAIFIKNKIKTIYPYYVFFLVTTFIMTAIAKQYTSTKVLDVMFKAIPELLMLQQANYYNAGLNGAAWYISAMLLAMLMIYPFLRKNYSLFTHIIGPLAVIFIGGELYSQFNTFTSVWPRNGIFQNGLLRALCFISLGCICFEFNRVRAQNVPTRMKRLGLTFLEFICFAVAIYLSYSEINAHRQLCCLILITIATTITFSQKSYFADMLKGKIWAKLGEFSFPLFLSQLGIRVVVLSIDGLTRYATRLPVYIILCFLYTIIAKVFIDGTTKLIQKRKKQSR